MAAKDDQDTGGNYSGERDTGSDDDPVAEQIAKGSVRLEVVAEPDQLALATRSTRLATGMFAGTLLCMPQIIDAASGEAAFEATMIRLLMLVGVCVAASIGLGSLFDSLTDESRGPSAAPPSVAAMTDDGPPAGTEPDSRGV